MPLRAVTMLLVWSCIVPLTGCGVRILNADVVVYAAPDRPGYKEISEGALNKLLKCCNACLNKKEATP